MKRMIPRLIAFATSLLLIQSASAEVRAWIGSGGSENWSDPANWQGGKIADGDDVAVFAPPASGVYSYIHRLTPPLSFTGALVTSNELSFATSWWTTKGPIEVAPAILDGATWKIGGNGTFVVCEGFGSHVPSTFVGKLIVPKGVSFTAPADLNEKVILTGDGTLTLSSVHQLSQATAFVGKIVLPTGDLALSNLGGFANASVCLADGQVLSLSGHDAAYSPVDPIGSFVDYPDKWTFNGSISTTDDGTKKQDGSDYPEGAYNKLPPYVKDGVLYLTDDPSQCHTVWYKDRYFRYGDEVGMKFTWTPALPTNPHVQGAGRGATLSGVFTVSFQGESETNCKTGLSMSDMRYLHATSQNGFFVYIYRGDNNPRIGWIAEDTIADGRDSVPEAALNIMLNKPIDFSVTIDKGGLMTVTLEQEGKSETFTKSYSTQFSARTAKGFYVGFTGASDTWGPSYGTMPWVSHQISHFRGWSRSDFGGRWTEIANASDFTLNASNWATMKGAKDGTYVENSESTFESDGTVKLVTEPSTMTMLMSTAKVDCTKPTRIVADIGCGVAIHGGSGNKGAVGMTAGLRSNNSASWGAGWNANGFWEVSNSTGWLYGMIQLWNMTTAQSTYYHSVYSGSTSSNSKAGVNRLDGAAGTANQIIQVEQVMDPEYGFKSLLTKSPSSYGNGSVTRHDWAFDEARKSDWIDAAEHPAFTKRNVFLRAAAGTVDYLEMTLKKLAVMQMTEFCAGSLSGGLSLPAGAAVTFKAGEMPVGQDLEFVRMADVTLENDATLTVVPEKTLTKVVVDKVTARGGVMLVAGTGASALVDEIVLEGSLGDTFLSASGSVGFPDQMTIVIPDNWIKAKGRHKIVACDGSLPVGARIVSVSGVDLTERAQLMVKDGALTACFEKGFMLQLR